MPTYKNIRVAKRGGGTRLQRVQVLKNGKYKFVKNKKTGSKKTGSKKKGSKKKGSKKKRSVSTNKGSGKMAKKRSWITYARLGVYALAAGAEAIRLVSHYGVSKTAAVRISQSYTGRDHAGKLNIGSATQTYGPLAAVAVVDGIASKAGVYQRMGKL